MALVSLNNPIDPKYFGTPFEGQYWFINEAIRRQYCSPQSAAECMPQTVINCCHKPIPEKLHQYYHQLLNYYKQAGYKGQECEKMCCALNKLGVRY